MSQDEIFTGTVHSVLPGSVLVLVERRDACGGCSVRDRCATSPAHCRGLLVRVSVREDGLYKAGDGVLLVASRAQGIRAVVLGYLLPLVLLVASVLCLGVLVRGEVLIALLSLSVLALYFSVLRLLRGRFSGGFEFRLLSPAASHILEDEAVPGLRERETVSDMEKTDTDIVL